MSDSIFEGDIDTATIRTARNWLRPRAKNKGAYCPCCKQFVKIYRRALGAPMARWLIWLVRTWNQQYGTSRLLLQKPNAWVDIRQSPVRGGDYAKLIHWGLVEQKPKPDTDKKNGAKDTRDSGMWRPTYKGIDFVFGKLEVPSHVFLYDNEKMGEEKKLITIQQALGKKYSYSELMNAPVNVEVPL